MTTINRSDIEVCRITVWRWVCPRCKLVTRNISRVDVADSADCDNCSEGFDIIEDEK